jgi:hypothetical protein
MKVDSIEKIIEEEVVTILSVFESLENKAHEVATDVYGEFGEYLCDELSELISQQREELIKLIKESTPRYIKGGELRTQYYAKGYNDFREDVIKYLSQQREKGKE